MLDLEQLGSFYLGRVYDLKSGKVEAEPVNYDARDLTTHAVIVGMTGSGKTGLGITLLEEAAIDGIPALIIDPKGDMGNLALTFPSLSPADFQPWIEPDEAVRQGQSVDEYAAARAASWKQGLADWGMTPERIALLQESADVAIYTPGSETGLPVSVLRSLAAPADATRDNGEALREQVATTASGLLTLLGIDVDPLRSREYILLSNILQQAWQSGRSLDLPQLIREIQSPPFSKVGVMDVESIFPATDRMGLAMTINNVLASPSFAAWTTGEPLNIQKLLYTGEGKPRLSILSIAHLSERERIFFVTLLLNEVISWMRSQPGTSSLRAILYMDEMFGFLPPTANPSTKVPLLTLLKQARAYGLGLVLATQNPVDLDYKALSNAGTWFLGRLQTERDKARVLDGLEGASVSAGHAFNRQDIDRILSGLRSRVFYMNNVHEDRPVVFQTRWALSYLRGPLTREQIQRLTPETRTVSPEPIAAPTSAPATSPAAVSSASPALGGPAPILPPEIRQRHLPIARQVPRGAAIVYRPALLAVGQAHYVDSKSKTDVWRRTALLASAEDGLGRDPWPEAEEVSVTEVRDEAPPTDARYAELPEECARSSSYRSWSARYKEFLYRDRPLTLSCCAALKLYSTPEEREGDFRARLNHLAREQRDLDIEKLKTKQASKVAALEERIRRAEQKVAKERQQASSATMSAAMTFGTSLLAALFGRKKLSSTNVSRAATSMRAAGRAADQHSDIKRAEENVETLQADLQSLHEEIEQQLNSIREEYLAENLVLEPYEIAPRKSDVTVDEITLTWLPYQAAADGGLRPAFDSIALPETEE